MKFESNKGEDTCQEIAQVIPDHPVSLSPALTFLIPPLMHALQFKLKPKTTPLLKDNP